MVILSDYVLSALTHRAGLHSVREAALAVENRHIAVKVLEMETECQPHTDRLPLSPPARLKERGGNEDEKDTRAQGWGGVM